MKIKIIAMATEDGWGIIKKDEKIFILRPPYENTDLIEISTKEFEKAICIYGYEECDIPLGSLNEVITLLKTEFVEAMKKIGVGRMPSSQLRELLKFATEDILKEYLDRCQTDLIPSGKLDAAESIAFELKKLEKVIKNPELTTMAFNVLEKCSQKRKEKQSLAMMTNTNKKESWSKFKSAMKKYSFNAIMTQGQIVSTRGRISPNPGGA